MDVVSNDTMGRIGRARQATLDWLDRLQMDDMAYGISRISDAHDAAAWPGMLLPGTYNAILCRDLLDGLELVNRAGVRDWLLGHQRADGVFRLPGMRDEDVFKRSDPGETWRYIDWHVTNYSLGALSALDHSYIPDLGFAEDYLDPKTLKAWLADRDLRDPWLEGNNIVNLGGFLLAMRGQPPQRERADVALEILFKWHDYHQEASTGFWGLGQDTSLGRLHAMAGSMHNYHLWYITGRSLPYQERAVDYALSCKACVVSACIDVDLVDLLVHAYSQRGYRRGDIRAWLSEQHMALLAFQNSDGGFIDEREGVRRQDGWVRGYTEPQGISNTFSTWFRWIAIAMIADLFWPGHWTWRFRRSVGMGFRAGADHEH
jgi:hypothetical protein